MAAALVALMKGQLKWEGTGKQLLAELNKVAVKESIYTNSKSWPKAANKLNGKLKEVKSNLRNININIIEHYDSHKKHKEYTILNGNENASLTSATCTNQSMVGDENNAEISENTCGDSGGCRGINDNLMWPHNSSLYKEVAEEIIYPI